MRYILKHGDIMEIKNINKKLKVDIWKYGTDKVKISIKTKQLFIRILDNYSWDQTNIRIQKSYGSNNEWFIFIEDSKSYFEDIHNWMIRIGANIEDHRD